MKIAPRLLVLAPAALLCAACAASAGGPQTDLQPTEIVPHALPTVSDRDCCYLPSNPAPVGFAVPLGAGGLQVGVVSSSRPADDLVLNASPANPPPPSGFEYLLVRVSVHCVTAHAVPCDLSTGLQFLIQNPDGPLYDPAPDLTGIPELIDVGLVHQGAPVEGNLVYLVPAGAQGLVVAFTWPNNTGVALAIE